MVAYHGDSDSGTSGRTAGNDGASMTDVGMKAADRGILIGASATGKSTLAAHVLSSFRTTEPTARIMVFDTKPRWRGQRRADGTSPRKMYKNFVKGDTIPGAAILERPQDWSIVWDRDANPSQTVVVQRLKGSQKANVLFQLWCAEQFYDTQSANRPSLAYFDEGMDFFTTNGVAVGSDVIQRMYRAGREKGLATLIGVQRPKGINAQCLTETSWCCVFRINYVDDMKRLYDMGWPKGVSCPTYEQPHAFRLWREGRPVAPLYRLSKD